jgi:hypothetical protein
MLCCCCCILDYVQIELQDFHVGPAAAAGKPVAGPGPRARARDPDCCRCCGDCCRGGSARGQVRNGHQGRVSEQQTVAIKDRMWRRTIPCSDTKTKKNKEYLSEWAA